LFVGNISLKLIEQYNNWVAKLSKHGGKAHEKALQLQDVLGVNRGGKWKKSKKHGHKPKLIKDKSKSKEKIAAPDANEKSKEKIVDSTKPRSFASIEREKLAEASKPRKSTGYSHVYGKNKYDPYEGGKPGMYEKIHPEEKKPGAGQSGASPSSTFRPTANVRDMKLYNDLRIPSNATQAEIKTGYKKSALRTHPDKNNNVDTGFVAVNYAYGVLSKPECRRMYDSYGLGGVENMKQCK